MWCLNAGATANALLRNHVFEEGPEVGYEAYDTEDITKYMCDRMQQVLDRDFSKVFGFFIGSFSRASDDLAQWRAYGDKGRGFAIGLARISQTM